MEKLSAVIFTNKIKTKIGGIFFNLGFIGKFEQFFFLSEKNKLFDFARQKILQNDILGCSLINLRQNQRIMDPLMTPHRWLSRPSFSPSFHHISMQ